MGSMHACMRTGLSFHVFTYYASPESVEAWSMAYSLFTFLWAVLMLRYFEKACRYASGRPCLRRPIRAKRCLAHDPARNS